MCSSVEHSARGGMRCVKDDVQAVVVRDRLVVQVANVAKSADSGAGTGLCRVPGEGAFICQLVSR